MDPFNQASTYLDRSISSYLDQFIQDVNENIEQTMDSIASVVKKNTDSSLKLPERRFYEAEYPDDVINLVVHYTNFWTRLQTLPHVSYQFYLLTRPYAANPYQLSLQIPKIQEIFDKINSEPNIFVPGPTLFALNFKDVNKLSLRIISITSLVAFPRLDVIIPNEKLSCILKSSIESSFRTCQNDEFNFVSFLGALADNPLKAIFTNSY